MVLYTYGEYQDICSINLAQTGSRSGYLQVLRHTDQDFCAQNQSSLYDLIHSCSLYGILRSVYKMNYSIFFGKLNHACSHYHTTHHKHQAGNMLHPHCWLQFRRQPSKYPLYPSRQTLAYLSENSMLADLCS